MGLTAVYARRVQSEDCPSSREEQIAPQKGEAVLW